MSDELVAGLFRKDRRRSPDGVCYGFEDGLDGFAIHAEGCPSVGHSWSGPNSSCPRSARWRGPHPTWARKPVDPVEIEDHPGRRLRACVAKWPDCSSMAYDPACCRFPKSCSATAVADPYIVEEDLEPVSHTRQECIHGKLISQCRCTKPNKQVVIVPCPSTCATEQADIPSATISGTQLSLHGLTPSTSVAATAAASAQKCGASKLPLPPERTCQLPAGHEGHHEVNDSMGRVEFYWPQTPPPVGLRPRIFAIEDRLREIEEAVARYTGAGLHLPKEWTVEHEELVALLRRLKSPQSRPRAFGPRSIDC